MTRESRRLRSEYLLWRIMKLSEAHGRRSERELAIATQRLEEARRTLREVASAHRGSDAQERL